MSRIRNANEFLIEFRRISQNYEYHFRQKIEEIRKEYRNNPTGAPPPFVDDSLEAHARQYVINELLQSLNWRLNCSPTDGLPNMVPEAPIGSVATGTTRFLDYLGFEWDCNKPLLIVEAKRPSTILPQPNDRLVGNTAVLISSALNGNIEGLTMEWNGYLTTLRDYVRTSFERTDYIPKRVVITNGDWLIVFTDPEEAFINERPADPSKILIWDNRNEIEQRYVELYREIEHSAVLGEHPSITAEELLFYVQPKSINRLMHGIRLTYFEEPQMYFGVRPQIKVAPLVFIGTQVGSWLRVEKPIKQNVFELPHSYDQLGEHLNMVKEAAESLLNGVKTLLSSTQDPISLTYHYRTLDSLDLLKGVKEERYNAYYRITEYIIVTGHDTHYLKAQPSISDCPYHEWSTCQQHGVAIPQSICVRSTDKPRSYFISNELHHCAHQGVDSVKSNRISEGNRERCGPRSGEIGCAFCEIYSIENLLCCRTCFLEEVCTIAQVFVLPCRM